MQTLGYGIYNFFLIGRIDLLDESLLASLSLDAEEVSKISIQFSHWSFRSLPPPFQTPPQRDNLRYIARGIIVERGGWLTARMDLNGDYTTHRIIWHPNSLSFLSLHGHYEADPPSPQFIIRQFQCHLRDYPVSDTERVTISLSKKDDEVISTSGSELIVARFAFQPL